MGNGRETPERERDRRSSDRWTPPVHSIRSVPQIVALDAVLLLILLGTFFFVMPGTIEALYGITEDLTAVHVGPGLLLLTAAGISLMSIVTGMVAISTGFPRIMRGDSSRSGRFSRRSMHAALLAATLAIVQLAVFALVLPSQVSG